MSVNIYRSTLRNLPEDLNLQQRDLQNLKSRNNSPHLSDSNVQRIRFGDEHTPFPSAAGFRLSFYSDRIFLLWIVRWCLISVGIWKRAHSLSRPRCAQSAGLSEYPLLYSSECCGQMAGCTLKEGKCGEFEDKLLEQEERQRYGRYPFSKKFFSGIKNECGEESQQ